MFLVIAELPHDSDLLDVNIQDLRLQGVYSQFVHGHSCKWSRAEGKRQRFGQWLVDGVLKGDSHETCGLVWAHICS